jgi:small-conductance mechanosensitive channel
MATLMHMVKKAILAALFGLLLFPVLSFSASEAIAPVESVAVVVWNREITRFRAAYEHISAAQRAKGAAEHILEIPSGKAEYKIEAIDGTMGSYSGAWIRVNDRNIFGILKQDIDSENDETFEAFKQKTVDNLRTWLVIRSEQEKWPLILKGLGFSLVASLAYGLILIASIRYGRSWLNKRASAVSDGTSKSIIIGDVNIKPYLISLEIGLFKILIWGLGLALGYILATFVLSQFPYSEPWGTQLSAFLFDLFKEFGLAFVAATPNLFTVLVIYLLTNLFVRVVTAFFRSAESGIFQSVWLQPETARATRRMVVVLVWIFALVVAYPYIPGSSSEAFKGISVFLGLMLSLGSAGMVGQVVGGLVVVYSRAFRTGEYVKIGEHEGFIREIGVLSTKMSTFKQEEITIPNAVLVSATTVNYSRHAEGGSAVMSTTITIGYDTPWRQVHGLLLLAAERTPDIMQNPLPRVMQRALSDFYVEYQLLFRIPKPEQRNLILSELHGQIQDAFNEYGVQIMSPHFEMQPDGVVVVPKSDWRKPPSRQ